MQNPSFQNILIVEDDESSFLYLQYTLEDCNYFIYRALDGQQAINYIKNKNVPIDLILMDIKLPEVDGYAATEEIRKIKPEIPIIAQTAIYLQSEIQKIIAYKMNAILIKPYSSELLLNTIRCVLENKSTARRKSNSEPLFHCQ